MAAQGLLRENWASTTSLFTKKVEMRSERRLWSDSAQNVKSLYQASSERFYADSGSPYPCSQSELDFHHQGRYPRENRGPFVSLSKATEEVIVQNDERRRPSFDERRAIPNLANVVQNRTYRYHPDIVVKVFNDLDTVFFGGRLSGNVLVSWANSTQCAEFQQEMNTRFLGCTNGFMNAREQGHARIYLNPNEIFLINSSNDAPLWLTVSTLLHEMVHAYKYVRSPQDARGKDCHDEYFCTKIDVIHQRALRILGINVIKRWEPFRQSLWFKDFVDEAYINRSPGTYDSSKHDDGHRHDQGIDDSPSDAIGRRDEWSRSQDGSLGDSVSKLEMAAGSVILAVLLLASWWGGRPGTFLAVLGLLYVMVGRDERGKSQDGGLDDSVSKLEVGACLVFLAVLLASWWGELPETFLAVSGLLCVIVKRDERGRS